MKKTLLATAVAIAAAIGLTGMAQQAAFAATGDNIIFFMRVSAGAAACVSSNASGRVTVSDLGTVQNMHVEVSKLPANTEFTVFVLQVPTAPFGLAWYQGDILTNASGRGIGDFTGIFSIETFIVAPGVAPAPKVFPQDATTNPATPPVQLYHMGIWFADPADAASAGCPDTVTPFDGDHEAGIQVLNTSNFGAGFGPLRKLQ